MVLSTCFDSSITTTSFFMFISGAAIAISVFSLLCWYVDDNKGRIDVPGDESSLWKLEKGRVENQAVTLVTFHKDKRNIINIQSTVIR